MTDTMSANPNNTPAQKQAWKSAQKTGSRFVRVIDSPKYAAYLNSPASRPVFDATGRRVK